MSEFTITDGDGRVLSQGSNPVTTDHVDHVLEVDFSQKRPCVFLNPATGVWVDRNGKPVEAE